MKMNDATETPNSATPAPATPETTPAPTPTAPPTTTEAKPEALLNAAAPEPFSFEKLALPEGFTIADEVKTSLSEIATKHNLTHAAMTDLAAIHIAETKAMQERLAAQVDTTWTETQTAWTKTVHEKFGGEAGAIAAAGRFAPIIDQYGGAAFREALNITGFGNHPAAFEFFDRLSKVLGEATPVNATAAPSGNVNPLAEIYPSLAKKG
jgi:hypothetical protein